MHLSIHGTNEVLTVVMEFEGDILVIPIERMAPPPQETTQRESWLAGRDTLDGGAGENGCAIS